MKKYLYILAGGAAGAILRFLIKKASISEIAVPTFPWGTFIANLSGAFLLAFFLKYTFETALIDADLRIGISTGFFGAFTTFSAFTKEIVTMTIAGNHLTAVLYLTISIFVGLIMAFTGISLAKRIIYKKGEI